MTVKSFPISANYLQIITTFLCIIFVASASLAHETHEKSDDQSDWVLFSKLLPDVPGKRITVVDLKFPPKSEAPGQSAKGHRHSGSVYVYVTEGSVRFGIEGEPVQLLHAGDSFFEPAGALHTVAENASDTEPAAAIAVLILPDGAPITTFDE